MKTKDAVLDCVKHLYDNVIIKRRIAHGLKDFTIQSDNGEFKSEAVLKFLLSVGGSRLTCCAYAPETQSAIERIPAVIQKSDKTARPQIISNENNPKIHKLMQHYFELSGIPLILNTSFNTHGEPIIENPNHALKHLKNNVVDKLIIGSYVYQNR